MEADTCTQVLALVLSYSPRRCPFISITHMHLKRRYLIHFVSADVHKQKHTHTHEQRSIFFHQLIQKYSEYKTLVYGYDANFVLKGPVGLLRQAGMSGRMLMRIYSVAFPCDDGGIAIPQKAALSDSHLLTHSSGCVCVARAKNRKLGRNAVHQQGSTRQTWERSASFELAPV